MDRLPTTRWRASGVAAGAASMTVTVALLFACSGQPSQPPPLNDCSGTTDAACIHPVVTGGSPAFASSSSSSSSSTSGSSSLLDGASCGIAGSLNAANASCNTCIETSCCMVAQACAGDSQCMTLIGACAGCNGSQACSMSCLADQSNVPQSSAINFEDVAACVNLNCRPQCPSFQTFVDQ